MKASILSAIFALSVSAFPHHAAAEEVPSSPAMRLLEVMEYEKTMLEASSAMIEPMMRQFEQLGLPPEALMEVRTAYEQFMHETFSDPAILQGMVEIYENNFTPAEIEELILFYDTPLGRKLILAEPAINSASMELGQKAAEKNQDEFQMTLMEIMQKHQGQDAGEDE